MGALVSTSVHSGNEGKTASNVRTNWGGNKFSSLLGAKQIYLKPEANSTDSHSKNKKCNNPAKSTVTAQASEYSSYGLILISGQLDYLNLAEVIAISLT